MITRDILLALPVVALGWLAVLVGVGFVSKAAPAQIVVLPSEQVLTGLAPEVAIVDNGPLTVRLASDADGFVADLYRAGARLVLPAGLPGCSGRPEPQRVSAL